MLNQILKIACFILFPPFYKTRRTAAPIKPLGLLKYKLGLTDISWPIHRTSTISGAKFIKIGVGTAPGLSPGCYIFAASDSRIIIGDYTIIAPNVIIAGYNHDLYDYRKKGDKKGISIGKYCWIAANVCITPGVKLGNHVIVGANSVVTKSFEEGYCVIGGNPARVIRKIDKPQCFKYKNKYEYVGYKKIKSTNRRKIK